MTCQRCQSTRILHFSGKTSDMASYEINGKDTRGGTPYDAGIGGGDYVQFNYCLACGQIQGTFPVAPLEAEIQEVEDLEDEEEEDDKCNDGGCRYG